VGTTVERLLPTDDDGVAEALLELTREIATKELAPQVHEAEERGEFPESAYRLLGKSGMLSLPFPEEYGGGG
jgi:alkylation response protein AidB-like acyl-CoA dehydrogenase